MPRPWKELYRVDNVPWVIWPFWFAISVIIGWSQYYLIHVLPHITSRVEILGKDPRQSHTPAIYAIWHSEIFALFTALRKMPGLVGLNHPLWYMKPTHVLLKRFGVERLFLGSTGHSGKEAAQRLAQFLRTHQNSTFINPDGPSGPYHELKKGVLHIAAQSGLPVVAIQVRATRAIRMGGWDRKLFPLPFSHIQVQVAEPVYVNTDNFAQAEAELKIGLG